jgi:hypothetical protein
MASSTAPNHWPCRLTAVALVLCSCLSPAPGGLARSQPSWTTVKFDWYHTPFPDIPLPNDIAGNFDPTSPTRLRLNSSLVAPSVLQQRVRKLIDQLDGWGSFQAITIPFTGPIDVSSITAAQSDPHYGLADDVIYLINIDPRSPNYRKIQPLDFGNGSYPVELINPGSYWKNDPRGDTVSMQFEEHDEDVNHNGILDLGGWTSLPDGGMLLTPPEDTDCDGILDVNNYLPGKSPAHDTLAERADALMSFYDRETNTVIARPLEPLDERTTYAVVVTRRLKDAEGNPVGSPFPFINHAAQTDELAGLPDALPAGLALSDIAFTYAFTTQTEASALMAVRDGLYGYGVQKQLGAKYPAAFDSIAPARDAFAFPGMKNQYLLYSEQFLPMLEEIESQLFGSDPKSQTYKDEVDVQSYIDFIVQGSYQSPQLFPRTDSQGNMLPLDEQVWPPDITVKPAPPRSETIYFTLTVPRKEVSARGQGKPAPVIILTHSYMSSRIEGLLMAGFFAKYGFATFSIDGPSHGLPLTTAEEQLVVELAQGYGIGAFGQTVIKDRAFNWNNNPDGQKQPGADFWTSYAFHTRDMVRQYAVDLMNGIRILRTFDGKQHWAFDLNRDGKKELAGDFDADGVVDLTTEGGIGVAGGSLGGIMAMIVGPVEPLIKVAVPISGGGGFQDMGSRTTQSGALEGFMLRILGPLFVGTLDPSTNQLTLETIVNDLNKSDDDVLATISDVHPWDTMLVENLTNGVRGCGFISDAAATVNPLTVRASVESDAGDRLRISFFAGPVLNGDTQCGLRDASVKPYRVVDTFEAPVQYQWKPDGTPNVHNVGDPLVVLADGYGLRRAHPDMRRFLALGQLVLDSTDPAVLAPHAQLDPLIYSSTGEKTGAHLLVSSTMGDPAVPSNAGSAFARAAGILDYLHDDARYGEPPNQVLIDHHQMESACSYARYTLPDGTPTCYDVDDFSQGTDMWGTEVPRLNPPLHLGFAVQDPLGGVSASVYPFPSPGGQHAFDYPGGMLDDARSSAGCKDTCMEGLAATDPCSCETQAFDIGWYMFNMIGRYVKSGGTAISDDLCQARDNCPDRPPEPPARSGAAIDAP